MVEIFNPATTGTEGLTEFAPDTTAARNLVFYHASEGKPLATPLILRRAADRYSKTVVLFDPFLLGH